MSGFGPREERETKHIKRRAEVRSTAELGGGPLPHGEFDVKWLHAAKVFAPQLHPV